MPNRCTVKICGITNPDDALAAAEAGADALGFIFYKKSPRAVTPAVAKEIISVLPPFITTVGVFVNEEAKMLRDIMDTCGLALAQLHGEESAAYCLELARPVVKAIRVKDRTSLLALAEFQGRANVRGFLLDSYSTEAYGGTGITADWSLAAELARSVRVILAGGLTPDNVGEAVQRVRPYGVDVSSGVEASLGKKDHAKVRAFISQARVVTSS